MWAGYKNGAASVKFRSRAARRFRTTTRGDVANREDGPELSGGMHSLLDSSKPTSEAFTIIATEMMEVKAMLMALIDLAKVRARRRRRQRARA